MSGWTVTFKSLNAFAFNNQTSCSSFAVHAPAGRLKIRHRRGRHHLFSGRGHNRAGGSGRRLRPPPRQRSAKDHRSIGRTRQTRSLISVFPPLTSPFCPPLTRRFSLALPVLQHSLPTRPLLRCSLCPRRPKSTSASPSPTRSRAGNNQHRHCCKPMRSKSAVPDPPYPSSLIKVITAATVTAGTNHAATNRPSVESVPGCVVLDAYDPHNLRQPVSSLPTCSACITSEPVPFTVPPVIRSLLRLFLNRNLLRR